MIIDSAAVKTWLAWCCCTLFNVTCAVQSDTKTVYISRENTVNYIHYMLHYLAEYLANTFTLISLEWKARKLHSLFIGFSGGSREVMAFLMITSPFNLQAILETVKTGHLLRDTLHLYILTLYFLKRIPTCVIIKIRIYFCVLFGLLDQIISKRSKKTVKSDISSSRFQTMEELSFNKESCFI